MKEKLINYMIEHNKKANSNLTLYDVLENFAASNNYLLTVEDESLFIYENKINKNILLNKFDLLFKSLIDISFKC